MLEINLKNLTKNVEAICSSNRKLIGVVKNNAYGCGSIKVSRHLISLGVDILFVNDIVEAIPLLEEGIEVKLIVHNPIPKDYYYLLKKYPNIVVTINSKTEVENLLEFDIDKVSVHIQIDTKMNRLGVKEIGEFDEIIRLLNNEKFSIEGIYTHFASTKTMDEQLEKFKNFASRYPFPIIHCAATFTYPLTNYGNYVRVGLGLYDINQVMSVKTKAIKLIDIKQGESVGYEAEYVASKDTKLAVLPIGYGDGYRRRFEGFYVYANKKHYNIVGRICMNHMFVEVDDEVDEHTIFEVLSENIKASELGKYANCSNYEIYTMFKVNGVKYIQ